MTNYKNIFGKPVKFLSADPDNAEAEGQIWYNSTAGAFKNILISEAWSSGSVMVRGSDSAQLNLGTGIQTAALVAGGYSPYSNLTEEYNGSGWSSGGNLSTARITSGFGTQTAGVAVGGLLSGNTTTNATEEYDGSSWTAGGNLNTARSYSGGSGTLTAGLSFGGLFSGPGSAPFSTSNATETYNGTAFTSVNNMNVYGRHMGSSGRGPQTATLAFGGGGGPTAPIPADTPMATTESWDGTNWTTVNSMNTARRAFGSAGIQTSALAFGGSTPPNTNATESWDGTNWTTSPATLANARSTPQSIGTSSSALYAGGAAPLFPGGLVEEYNRSINVITAGAWASGGNMNTGRGTAGDCGTYLAGLVFGGNPGAPPYQVSLTEEYNGTSWSESGDIAHDSSDVSGAGTQTAALAFGLSAAPNTITQHYDGSTWTTVPATLPTSQQGARGIGTQTAAISVGNGTPGTGSFEYDGSTWTAGGTTNNSRSSQKPGGWGIQTAAVIASGYSSPPATIISNTETYDGTTWTETGHSVVTAVKRTAATTAGTSSDGMLNGGGDNAGTNDSITTTQGYNGTSWFTQPSLATPRLNLMGFGTSANAVAAGGDTYPAGPVGRNVTEEFTGETSALNVKTLTTS